MHTISRSHPSYCWRAGDTAALWHNSRQTAAVPPSTTNRDHTTHEIYEVYTSVFIVWHAERQPTQAEFELWRHLEVRSQSHSHPGFQRALQEKQLQMPQWNLEYRVIGLWLLGCPKSCHWLKLILSVYQESVWPNVKSSGSRDVEMSCVSPALSSCLRDVGCVISLLSGVVIEMPSR